MDLTRAAHPALWLVLWDPTQPTATRPLAIQKDGSWFTYGHDITKNVWEVFGPSGYVRTSYDYAPFGAVSATGDVTQPFQWSSEVYDSELGLVYYNYRHYSPADGRWLSRDPIEEEGGLNLYAFVRSCPLKKNDNLGLAAPIPIWLTALFRKYGWDILKYLAEELIKSYMACDGGAVVGSVANFQAKVKTDRQCSVPHGAQVPKWYFCKHTSGESRGFAKFICRSNFPLPSSWEFLEWISPPDSCGTAPSCAAGCCDLGCNIKFDSIENVFLG